jgi:hypothetical protein
LRLHVRRFFCINQACHRAIFCERLGTALLAYARRTARLEATLQLLGFRRSSRCSSHEAARDENQSNDHPSLAPECLSSFNHDATPAGS